LGHSRRTYLVQISEPLFGNNAYARGLDRSLPVPGVFMSSARCKGRSRAPLFAAAPCGICGPPSNLFHSEKQAEQSGYGENAVIKMACGKGCSMNGRRDGPEGSLRAKKRDRMQPFSQVLIRGPLVSRTLFRLSLGGRRFNWAVHSGADIARHSLMPPSLQRIYTSAQALLLRFASIMWNLCAKPASGTVLDPAWRVLQYLGTVLYSEI
jgi:hypothetical protein